MVESVDILQRVLERRGYIVKALGLQNGTRAFVQICDSEGHALLTLAAHNPLYPFATSSARLIARNKMISYEYVTRNGVPVPRSVVVSPQGDRSEAVRLLKDHGPVIVKPIQGAGGVGLTLDVTTEEELDRALEVAWQNNAQAIVQRQFFGEEVRFAVINGKAEAALLRQKPRVIGDGFSTVAQLIAKENSARQGIIDTIVPYPQLTGGLVGHDTMVDQTVLASGKAKELNKNTMIRGGASVYDSISTIDPGYIEAAERAAQGLGRGYLVVDMMIEDYTKPSSNDNHVFIEFNLAPALSLFYSCRDGKHVPIAEKFLVPMLESVMRGYCND